MLEAVYCSIANGGGAFAVAFTLDRGHLARFDLQPVACGINLRLDLAFADVSCPARKQRLAFPGHS